MNLKEHCWIFHLIVWFVAAATLITVFGCLYKKAMQVRWEMCEHLEICDLDGVTGHGDWYE